MPAHIGIADQLSWGLGVAMQGMSEKVASRMIDLGLDNAVGAAHLRGELAKTNKGRNTLDRGEDGDYDTPLTFSEANRILEMQRKRRETRCHSYDQYRSWIDNLKTSGKDIFFEKGHNLTQTLVHLTYGSGYHEKDHDKFKEEWRLYLARDTFFDGCVRQFFTKGYEIILINGTGRHAAQLKRIEAKKKGTAIKILWSAA